MNLKHHNKHPPTKVEQAMEQAQQLLDESDM
jgi:ribosome maturation protein Sdo1